RDRSRHHRQHVFQRYDEFFQWRFGRVWKQRYIDRLSHPQRVPAVSGYASAALNIYLAASPNPPRPPAPGGFVFPTGVAPFQACLDSPVNPVPPATCPVFTVPPAPPFDAYVARM